jgi:hypothetical protein
MILIASAFRVKRNSVPFVDLNVVSQSRVIEQYISDSEAGYASSDYSDYDFWLRTGQLHSAE